MANRAFIRFRDITIPNYSVVSNVFARFTSYSNKSSAPVNLRCAFVNEDNPDAPTSEAELQAFDLTDWVSWNTLNSWIDGTEYDTPDLTSILQSVVNRSGWDNGNSVILIIEDVSSSGQRGFSSIQYGTGEERAVLFANYLMREGLPGSNYGVEIQQYITSANTNRFVVRTSNGDLHCVYLRKTDAVYTRLCYGKSINNGLSWTETIFTPEGYSQVDPCIAVDSNDHIHILWASSSAEHPWGVEQLRYIKYTTSWSEMVYITDEGYSVGSPALAIDSNDILHLVYQGVPSGYSNHMIGYKKYTTSWSATTWLTTGDAQNTQQYTPSIAVDSNDNLHVAFNGRVEDAVSHIRYRQCVSGSWTGITEITPGDLNHFAPVSMAVDSNDNVHMTWHGYAGNTYPQLHYKKYTDGVGFGSTIILTDGNYPQYTPRLSIDGEGTIYIIWGGTSVGSPTMYQIRCITYTTGWSDITDLTMGTWNHGGFSMIWAKHPTIGGIKTNIPSKGFAFIWTERVEAIAYPYYTSSLKYWTSDDLTWET